MDRRSFIRGAGLATVGAAATTLAAPAIAQARTELRLVMPWTRDFPGLGTSAQRFADRLAAMTDGRITVTVYASGELVPPLGEYAAVADGRADLYHAPDYYYAAMNPALNFFTNAPFGLTAIEHTSWIEFGGGQALWDELSGHYGIKPFLIGNTGTQMGGWFKAPLTSVADVQGLKFRMPGLGGAVWKALGVTIVSLPAGQILSALQDGTLDGADWVGPWNDYALGIHQVAKNYYFPSVVEGGAALTIGLRQTVWEAMSASDQAIFRAACQVENAMVWADYQFNNAIALGTIRNETDIKVEPFPDEIIARMAEVAPAVASAAAVDELGRRIHDAYFAARETMRPWSEIADGQFIPARQRSLGP